MKVREVILWVMVALYGCIHWWWQPINRWIWGYVSKNLFHNELAVCLY
jgi:hypothetical protein